MSSEIHETNLTVEGDFFRGTDRVPPEFLVEGNFLVFRGDDVKGNKIEISFLKVPSTRYASTGKERVLSHVSIRVSRQI